MNQGGDSFYSCRPLPYSRISKELLFNGERSNMKEESTRGVLNHIVNL